MIDSARSRTRRGNESAARSTGGKGDYWCPCVRRGMEMRGHAEGRMEGEEELYYKPG